MRVVRRPEKTLNRARALAPVCENGSLGVLTGKGYKAIPVNLTEIEKEIECALKKVLFSYLNDVKMQNKSLNSIRCWNWWENHLAVMCGVLVGCMVTALGGIFYFSDSSAQIIRTWTCAAICCIACGHMTCILISDRSWISKIIYKKTD